MKFRFNPFFTGVAAASIIAASTVAFAQSADEPRANPIRDIFESLDLTDEQKQALRELMPRSGKKSRGPNLRALLPIALDDEINQTLLTLSLDALLAQKKVKAYASAERRHAIRQILTSEQIEELEQALAALERPERDGNMLGNLLSRLDLSEDQALEVESGLAALAELRDEMATIVADFRLSSKALIEAEEFDEDAYLALFDLHEPLVKAKGEEVVSALNAVYLVLDDEQQSQLKRMLKRLSKAKNRGNRKGRN